MAPIPTTLTLTWDGDATGFVDCNPLGSVVTITDAFGNTFITHVPIAAIIPGSYVINLVGTPLNLATNLTVHIDACFRKISDGTTCERCIDYIVYNAVPCPKITLKEGDGETPLSGDVAIEYSIDNTLVGATYEVSIYDGITLIETQTIIDPAVGPVVGAFTGLTPSTLYTVVVRILVDDVLVAVCHPGSITTLDFICKAPTEVEANTLVE